MDFYFKGIKSDSDLLTTSTSVIWHITLSIMTNTSKLKKQLKFSMKFLISMIP